MTISARFLTERDGDICFSGPMRSNSQKRARFELPALILRQGVLEQGVEAAACVLEAHG